MIRLPYYIAIFFLSFQLHGQGLHHIEGGASRARVGNIGTVGNLDAALYGNIACINSVQKWYIDVGYTHLYNLKRLRTISLSGAKSTKLGNIGAVITHYGYEALSESSIGLAYGRKLFDHVSLAILFRMVHLQAGTYGSTQVYTGRIGISYQLSKKLLLGSYIDNPVRSPIVDSHYLTPRIAVGIRYKTSKKVDCMLEIEKQSGHLPLGRVALLYRLVDALELSLSSEVTKGELAFGVKYNFIDYGYTSAAYTYNSTLGSTPSISLGYGR